MGKKIRIEEQKRGERIEERKIHWATARRKRISKVELRCEWVDCAYLTKCSDAFLEHVEQHGPHEEHRDNDGNLQIWHCCMWECCGFDSQSWQLTRFHINYHAFHTRLKALGAKHLANQPELDCHLDYEGRNLLPVLSTHSECAWTGCSFSTDSYQRFLNHADTHVVGRPRRQPHETVYCLWEGCNGVKKNFTNLKSHLKIHTQEKVIGCPVCGGLFACKPKLTDHCMRQLSHEKKRYKCSYCKKNFPSERILRDHIRLHVNLHKCPLCEMTCPYKYSLTLHMRYRHLSIRPFKCTFCDHWSTTERDLESHRQTHCSENFWACEQEGCEFSCRSKNGLATHYRKSHGSSAGQYACHICDAQYNRGHDLTHHLKKVHSYRWAFGHSRFRYIKDDSGLYRLLTVRYESIDVSQQIIEDKPQKRFKNQKKSVAFTKTFVAPDKVVITSKECGNFSRQSSQEDSNEEEVDDVVPLSQLAVGNKGEEKEEVDSDSEFGESLQKHFGLTGSGFIEVIKTNKHNVL